MNTYINDRKLSEYPFFNIGQSPMPPGCITYLGVCIQGSDDHVYPVYASAITVSMDGVLVSVCRELEDDENGEVLGSVYATSAEGSANIPITGSTIQGSISLMIDKELLQNNYGTYNGKFYLDPSCVTYMDASVTGSLKTVSINGNVYQASQGLNFSCMGGLLELVEDGNVALLKGSQDVDSYSLVVSDTAVRRFVETINNVNIEGNTNTYPEFEIHVEGGTDSAIQTNVVRGSTTEDSDLVVELIGGGTGFPHCYGGADEAEVR